MARTNSFEGGANGVTITTANSGGTSGDAFDNAPAPGATGVMTFSTAQAAHGSVSMTTSTGGTSALAYAGYNLATTSGDVCRVYCRFTSLPSAQQNFVRYLSTGSQSLRVNVTTAGLVEVRNAANTVVGTTTSAISAGSWFRLELTSTWSTTAGTVALRLYLSPDSTTISDSLSLSSLVLTASANEIRFGVGATMANAVQVWYDDLAIEGATWHGPVTRSITPTGVAVAATLGSPALAQSLSVTPTGIAVPATLGSPSIAQALTVIPDGLAVPLNLGAAAVAQPMSVAPTGIAVPASLGAATVNGTLTVVPDGIAVGATLGDPAVTMTVRPDGIAVPVTPGSAATGYDRYVHRPNSGTTSRPAAGNVVRPYTGTVERP